MPVYILHGEEEFEIAKAARRLTEKLVDPSWSAFNFSRLEHFDFKHIIEAASSVPFGPGNKVFLFEQCDLFTKRRANKSDDDEKASGSRAARLLEDLEQSLTSMHPNTYLIFVCIANFDKTLKVSKAFQKYAKFEEFARKKYYAGSANKELLTWANQEAHRCGAIIDDEAVFYLAQSTEVNLRQMAAEIEKAAVYVLPEQRICLAVVATLSPHFSHVFALLDHWAQGRKDKVLEVIQELQSRQISAHVVVATLQTTLSKWISYKTEMEKAVAAVPSGRDVRRRDVPIDELARQLSASPQMAFIVKQDLMRIKNLPLEFLVRKKRELTDLETSIKSGLIPEGHALSMFFAR